MPWQSIATLNDEDIKAIYAYLRSLPPVVAGSHIDTQPTGGKFDGNYGVLAGLEVVRTLNDHGIETEAPIEVGEY